MRLTGLVALALAAMLIIASGAHAATFNPEKIISDDNMRDYNSMSEKEIQRFLETQSGSLATLVTSDYDKVITLSKTKSNVNDTPDEGEPKKPASRIIWEACQKWKINPKVMLAMLQKEQSLITTPPKPGSTTLARAVGAGCPGRLVDPKNNPVATNRYPGFGNQIWHGARLLDGYGEGKNGSTIPLYYDGIVRWDIYRKPKVRLEMQNLATYKLYVYNPSIGAKAPYGDLSTQKTTGNANFWKIYNRYFGSTFASPRYKPVYRFRSRINGTYLYTASIAEKVKLQQPSNKKRWAYQGAKFKVDTSVPTTQTTPLYRFRNKNTGKYSWTTSKTLYKERTTAKGKKTWSYGGVAFQIAKKKTDGALTVWKFKNKKTGARLLTHSKSTRDDLRKAKHKRAWKYEGVAFYLPRAK